MILDLSNVTIDKNDPRPLYQRISSAIRAHVRLERIPPGTQLPSTPELVEHFDVSKGTLAKALDQLKADGIIQSHQGSGIYIAGSVVESVGMRSHVERIFDESAGKAITIDFAGISSETLYGALAEPLAKIRSGRYSPQSIDLRILIPDTSNPWPMPCNLDGTDNPGIRTRVQHIGERFADGLHEALTDLFSSGLIEGSVVVRRFGGPPTHKVISINKDTYVGFYHVVERSLKLPGQTRPTPTFALVGKETDLVHYSETDQSSAAIATVYAVQQWFESVWSLAT